MAYSVVISDGYKDTTNCTAHPIFFVYIEATCNDFIVTNVWLEPGFSANIGFWQLLGDFWLFSALSSLFQFRKVASGI